jgi:hypothetical protein
VTLPISNSEFKTERDAKEHLIARISAKAQQQGIELSEVERKMLYFSETGWTLPGILDVNAEFERDYDNDEYESKIAGVVRSIEQNNSELGGSEQSLWDEAVIKLSEGDHYLLVLIGLGRSAPDRRLSSWLPAAGVVNKRPNGDFFRLIVVAFAVLAAVAVVFWLRSRF